MTKKRLTLHATIMACVLLTLPALCEEADNHGLPLPIGNPNPASEWLFTGQSYITSLVTEDDTWNTPNMMNVTFEPCCRTDWHSHAGGQILIAIGGVGIHQVAGGEPELLQPGDVARVQPGVMHWHGAADEGWFSHIAVETNPDMSGFAMGDEVTDEIYQAALTLARQNAQ